MEAPKTKLDSFALLMDGKLGNRLRIWSSLKEAQEDASFLDNHVAVRLRSTPGLIPPRYCEPTLLTEVPSLLNEWKGLGIDTSLATFNECGHIENTVIQGEVYRNQFGLSLRYTLVKEFMRPALAKQSLIAEGLIAYTLLSTLLDTPSFENLMHLLDTYENGIVEFSTYSCLCGVEGWNTVFWELRDY